MTPPQARDLARQFAEAATSENAVSWSAGVAAMAALDGRAWLLIDQAARSFTHGDGTPVSGVRGWMGATLNEPSGFVAAVTALHVDGRLRERAVQVLGSMPAEVAAPSLALRLLDHVPQVRARAWDALGPLLNLETAEAVFDVLLAGAQRQHAPAALDEVRTALVDADSAGVVVARLVGSERRRVRRWAFELGHQHDLFADEELVAAADADSDQWIRARCAEWLMDAADPSVLTALLDATSVEARLVALTRVPDADLSDDTLRALLVDRAPRVREQARWRAGRRRLDVLAFYRSALADADASPRVVAACLDGLARSGDEQDLAAAVVRLHDRSGRVRAAAVPAVEAVGTREAATELLTPVLLDETGRVSSAAARSLARLGAGPSAAEAAWASGVASSRRAAWRLARAAGGWHRVEADLRAATDTDPQLAGLGRAGVRNWLDVSAATTWDPLPADQQARVADFLGRSGLTRDQQRVLAFHAGIRTPTEEHKQAPGGAGARPRRQRLLRLLRRT